MVSMLRPPYRVYPRVCGGTCMTMAVTIVLPGLSPRVRGNHNRIKRKACRRGSIPACAGEPNARATGRRPRVVYPRVCGGTAGPMPTSKRRYGLSPRVRGNPTRPCRNGTWTGSIPACAGEPPPRPSLVLWIRVYPRVCGGTGLVVLVVTGLAGLSPRVRGNQRRALGSHWRLRSIPACAGEPPGRTALVLPHRVYPRVCGGTSTRRAPIRSSAGLSPRVRGNQRQHVLQGAASGSIPACAGEPSAFGFSSSEPTVYPRVCGGTPQRCYTIRPKRGLSPRVRGNLAHRGRDCRAAGSIPACAGEPAISPAFTAALKVYPRVCGGTASSRSVARCS